jgi:hypothetical protein
VNLDDLSDPNHPTHQEDLMQELALPTETFELDQRRAKAYAESGYWPDAASVAKALVKIEAGRTLNLPAIMAMSEIHVIDGKPTVGAGALAALVKASRRYDFRVISLDNLRCVLRFYDRGEAVGLSEFTMKDAETAKLKNKGPWSLYPRNMLFARAMSNGVAWFCPDVASGRIYTPDELGDDAYTADDVDPELTVVEPDDEAEVDEIADEVFQVPAGVQDSILDE